LEGFAFITCIIACVAACGGFHSSILQICRYGLLDSAVFCLNKGLFKLAGTCLDQWSFTTGEGASAPSFFANLPLRASRFRELALGLLPQSGFVLSLLEPCWTQ